MVLYECDMCAVQQRKRLTRYTVQIKQFNEAIHPFKSDPVHLCSGCLTELCEGLGEIMKPIIPEKEEEEKKEKTND